MSKLDVTTAKIRTLFHLELSRCSQTGILDSNLYQLILQWRVKARCDIQLIESCNSVLTRMTSLSKRLEQPLVSARFTIKKELAEHRAAGSGALATQGAIAAVHNVVESYVGGSLFQALTNDPHRFLDMGKAKQALPIQGHIILPLADRLAPQAAGDVDGSARLFYADSADCPWRDCGLLAPERISRSLLESSAAACLQWSRNWPLSLADRCFWLLDPGVEPAPRSPCLPADGTTAYLCLSKHRNIGHWQKLRISGGRAELQRPFAFVRSTDVISAAWLALQNARMQITSTHIRAIGLSWTSGVSAQLLPSLCSSVSVILRSEAPKPKPQAAQANGAARVRKPCKRARVEPDPDEKESTELISDHFASAAVDDTDWVQELWDGLKVPPEPDNVEVPPTAPGPSSGPVTAPDSSAQAGSSSDSPGGAATTM